MRRQLATVGVLRFSDQIHNRGSPQSTTVAVGRLLISIIECRSVQIGRNRRLLIVCARS